VRGSLPRPSPGPAPPWRTYLPVTASAGLPADCLSNAVWNYQNWTAYRIHPSVGSRWPTRFSVDGWPRTLRSLKSVSRSDSWSSSSVEQACDRLGVALTSGSRRGGPFGVPAPPGSSSSGQSMGLDSADLQRDWEGIGCVTTIARVSCWAEVPIQETTSSTPRAQAASAIRPSASTATRGI